MTDTSMTPQTDTVLTEEQLIQGLQLHPDLLSRYPAVLQELQLQHDTGGAVSLMERQIKLLREENRKLNTQLNNLVKIARENEELSQRFHRLSLELLAGQDLPDSVALIQNQIETFFYTDFVRFYFLEAMDEALGSMPVHRIKPQGDKDSLIAWINRRKPVFGPFDEPLLQRLDISNSSLQSMVLLPIFHTRNFGFMMLGSKNPQRFTSEMGTLFLNQLVELVSSKLQLHLAER